MDGLGTPSYAPWRHKAQPHTHGPPLGIKRHPSPRPALPLLLPPPKPRPQQSAQATVSWAASPANKESVSVKTRREGHFSIVRMLVECALA